MKKLSALASAAAVTFSAANAAIIDGAVTDGEGIFVELTAPWGGASSPDDTVGKNTFDDPNLYAFFEGRFTVGADLALDIGGLTAGQKVDSFYVFFDPDSSTSVEGYIDFRTDIVGVATSTALVNATDVYSHPAITYLTPKLRGLETGDHAVLDGINRIVVDWHASSPGDFIRVFTVSDVPLPAGLWVFLTGLCGVAAKSRRKKSSS